MNNNIIPLNYEGNEVRTATLNGDPAIVLTDIAKILGYRDATNASRILRDYHKGYSNVSTPNGTQRMLVVTEQGFNRLVIRSNAQNAEAVQDWVTDEVLPQIRKTGSYGASALDLTSLDSISLLLDAGKAALNRAIDAETRAEVAEERIDLIEGGQGFSIREFKKHYFPDIPEKTLNTLLYSKGLLLDQRNTRVDKNGKPKNGPNHRDPSYSGNQYFYIDWYIHPDTGDRHGNTLVRPGKPETNLVAQLERWGLQSSKNKTKEIAA